MTATIESQVSSAIAEALIHAQGRQVEIARRSNPRTTARRLREEGAYAAASPMAHDQLLALALQMVAARASGPSRLAVFRSLAQAPDPLSQLPLREQVFRGCGPLDEVRFEAALAAAAEEERCRRAARDKPQVAAALRRSAALNRWFWDHPGIQMEPLQRAAMLLAAEVLDGWADELAAPARRPRSRALVLEEAGP